MNEQTAARLREAAESGEIVVVSYDGGSEGGTKRRIVVLKVLPDTAYVLEVGETMGKTYRLDRIRIVDESDGAFEWKAERKKRQLKVRVSPECYFETWSFDIQPALWAACGVSASYYVDKTQTLAARARVEAEGKGRTDVARIRVMERVYTHKARPEADFRQGDVFWSRDRTCFVQVVAFKEFMEVHLCKPRADGQIGVPRRLAYHLDDDQLLDWLRLGVSPTVGRISPADSYVELLRLSIIDPADGDVDGFL